jgi:hemolysin activation/secretion protein
LANSQAVAQVEPERQLSTNTKKTEVKAISVKQIEIIGNTVFSSKELEAKIATWNDKKVNLDQIWQIRSAITKLYVDSGYTTSAAFVPVQDFSGETIKFQVIEGKLESIKIKGLKHLSENYVRSRFKEVIGKPLNVKTLEEYLQSFNRNPLFKMVKADLINGSNLGDSVLELNIEEAPPMGVSLGVDNDISPSFGDIRQTVGIDNKNVLGIGDRLDAKYDFNYDGFERYELGYAIPLNRKDGTLAINYKRNDGKIIEDPFSVLDITTKAELFSVGFRQPLVKRNDREFALSLAFDLSESQTFLDDAPRQLTIGADINGKAKVSALRFSQDWFQRSTNTIVGFNSSLNFGLDLFDATVNEDAPDGRFFSWNGEFQWVEAFNEKKDFLLKTRIRSQLSPDELLPTEQFNNTVRGYRQNVRVGDNGVVGSVDLLLPIVRSPKIGVIQLAPFVDVGTVWGGIVRSDGGSNTLASVGLGLRWQVEKVVEARIDYGIPLIEVNNQGDSLQADGWHFSLNLVPFRF